MNPQLSNIEIASWYILATVLHIAGLSVLCWIAFGWGTLTALATVVGLIVEWVRERDRNSNNAKNKT